MASPDVRALKHTLLYRHRFEGVRPNHESSRLLRPRNSSRTTLHPPTRHSPRAEEVLLRDTRSRNRPSGFHLRQASRECTRLRSRRTASLPLQPPPRAPTRDIHERALFRRDGRSEAIRSVCVHLDNSKPNPGRRNGEGNPGILIPRHHSHRPAILHVFHLPARMARKTCRRVAESRWEKRDARPVGSVEVSGGDYAGVR